MDLTLCGQSAFYYYRIPPQVLGLYPAISLGNIDRRCCGLGSHAVVKDLLHAPLHRLVFTRAQSGSRSLFKSHLLTQEPPPGSFRQTEHGFDVTSPEFTLLSLATQVSRNQLLMACYEMCSSFAVFTPCERTQQQLDEAISLKFIPPDCGWKRIVDTKGNDTNLWKRAPLLSAADIAAFAKQAAGLRGVKQLRWAAERMAGQTASPFEVQTSMLVSLPRDEGGLGIGITNNARIPLSEAARSLYDKPAVMPISSSKVSPTAWASFWNAKAAPLMTAKLRVSPMPSALPHSQAWATTSSKLPMARSRTKGALATLPNSSIKRPGFPTPQRSNRSATPKMLCGKNCLSIGMTYSLPGRPASS